MIRAQVVGATGYGGLGIVELLLHHPSIEITSLLAKTDVGRPLSDFFPHLRGFCDRVVEDASPDRIGAEADLVVFATPDRVGMSYARQVLDAGAKMVDYSGDFRFRSGEQYDEYARLHPSTVGRPHDCIDLLKHSAYGIPELHREAIKQARLVGNPGCFAVAMILGLAPALHSHMVDPQSLICDGKTGSSGAGKKVNPVHHFPERNENVAPYRVAAHQHSVETTTALSDLAGQTATLTFVPHLLPTTRGILCTSYATLRKELSPARIHEAYCEFFANEPFVRVLPLGSNPALKSVVGSNICDVAVNIDQQNGRLIVISAIDNLLKGQAGIALQNINVMFGLPETVGLERSPMYP